MIKIENVEICGWEAAMRGMRNPLNSWANSDSGWYEETGSKNYLNYDYKTGKYYVIGDNDLDLMKRLSSAGNDHGKFMRMITVTCDIVAPDYWFKEFSTYKVGTVENSTSTMHKIHSKEFSREDFSHEHLIGEGYKYASIASEDYFEDNFENILVSIDVLDTVIKALNYYRQLYLKTNDKILASVDTAPPDVLQLSKDSPVKLCCPQKYVPQQESPQAR